MNKTRFLPTILAIFCCFLFLNNPLISQHSIARQWNEKVLEAIRKDFARPTVHARNLFHTSVAMYDIWAVYEGTADTYFLGKTVNGFRCGFTEIPPFSDKNAAVEEAMSFAIYRLMLHRFINSPNQRNLFLELDEFMEEKGYNIHNFSTNYHCGAAELGNYVAAQLIEYGLQDGANEANEYGNTAYQPVNEPLFMPVYGNPTITDYNRWQPLRFTVFVDQGGNPTPDNVPAFLSPEWGQVAPFALSDDDLTIYNRDGFDYWVYHDPGPPPYLDVASGDGLSDEYQWGHSLVSVWSSHLTPDDGVIWDISPASIGNIQTYPTTIEGLRDFYNLEEGGDIGTGHSLNPFTGQPYQPQLVKRGDYARVLAEFWADGPDSETPPGHWFTIINYVNDHPELIKKIGGQGDIVSDLEWDVKGYFALGGALHDVAIAAWGIKGWYDYLRPVSAIRAMADLGQSSDPNLPNYHPGGIPLLPGFIELVLEDDPLNYFEENLYQIKLRAWKGPNAIDNAQIDYAGVDWILAGQWWPYQRPTFVTPPFAGYISGHSTYSRAAAEVLTGLTGDPFFPGGMGEFSCPKDAFLVFEEGPSQDIILQWATYRDASDQCSLSRIWGGIHPPCDDIPGRLIGREIGTDAYNFAKQYFDKTPQTTITEKASVYPNPTDCGIKIYHNYNGMARLEIFARNGQFVQENTVEFIDNQAFIDLNDLVKGVYILVGFDEKGDRIFSEKIVVQ